MTSLSTRTEILTGRVSRARSAVGQAPGVGEAKGGRQGRHSRDRKPHWRGSTGEDGWQDHRDPAAARRPDGSSCAVKGTAIFETTWQMGWVDVAWKAQQLWVTAGGALNTSSMGRALHLFQYPRANQRYTQCPETGWRRLSGW